MALPSSFAPFYGFLSMRLNYLVFGLLRDSGLQYEELDKS